MKRVLFLAAAACIAFAALAELRAAEPDGATTLTLEQRIADLEAYINNGDRNEGSMLSEAGPGHNAWMMVCSALVLFMTLPGLALFYGGLVRRKNVLSILAQCLGVAGLVTLLWWLIGYSLAFSSGSPFFGNFDYALLNGVNSAPNGWISHNVFSMFQLMFAIITPALIVGAIAERMKYSAVLLFVALWMLAVYFPLAHMVWGGDGFMNGFNENAGIKAIDFAGGTVVHMSSGWSALVLCLILGPRGGFGKEPMPPHSMVLCMVGTGMLWVGWYGFNAGSALAADGVAAHAFTTTTLAAAIGGFTWGMAEYMIKGKPSVLGFCSGIVGGLVVITPACAFVSLNSAVLMGAIAGLATFLACFKLKAWLNYDDALDTFGVHGVGGTLGALLTGVFARPDVVESVAGLEGPLWLEQVKSILVTIVLAVVATAVIAFIAKAVVGLRVSEEVETIGLDLAEHGEEGYQR